MKTNIMHICHIMSTPKMNCNPPNPGIIFQHIFTERSEIEMQRMLFYLKCIMQAIKIEKTQTRLPSSSKTTAYRKT